MRWIAAALFAIPFFGATPVGAAGANVETFTETAWVSLDGLELPVSCINGGAGENVVFEGSMHIVSHYTLPENFAGNLVQSVNFGGMRAVGQTTGIVYRTSQSNRFVITFAPGDVVRTNSEPVSIHYVGPGRASDFHFHGILHTTINAAGEITASFDFEHGGCD